MKSEKTIQPSFKDPDTYRLYDGLTVTHSTYKDLSDRLSVGPIRLDKLGMYLIRKGSVRASINFVEYDFYAGDALFITPILISQIVTVSEDVEIYSLLLDFEIFKEFRIPICRICYMDPIQSNRNIKSSFNPQQAERLVVYMENLEFQNTTKGNTVLQEKIIQTTLMLVFYELSNEMHSSPAYDQTNFERKNRIVLDFLSTASIEFKGNHKVQYYADKLFISRKHLSRIVKEITGNGPKAILDELVISEAVVLLHNTNMSVKEVMSELGFMDFGAFSKFFKSFMGVSPLTYRKQRVSNNTEQESIPKISRRAGPSLALR